MAQVPVWWMLVCCSSGAVNRGASVEILLRTFFKRRRMEGVEGAAALKMQNLLGASMIWFFLFHPQTQWASK